MPLSIAFLLQTNEVTRLTAPLADYARHGGYDIVDCTSRADLDIMSSAYWVNWSDYDIVIPYGSVQLIRRFRETPLGYYITHLENGYSADTWIAMFGDKALNSGGQQMIAAEVAAHLEQHRSAHVRPMFEDKALLARLFTPDSWAEHREERVIRDDLDVFVSPPKVIEREYRCWIIGGEVIEISQYFEHGVLNKLLIEDPAVFDAARSLASIYLPAEAVVMDMAKTDEGFKFLEFNTFHCSGWYAGRVPKIMDAYIAWLKQKHDTNRKDFS